MAAGFRITMSTGEIFDVSNDVLAGKKAGLFGYIITPDNDWLSLDAQGVLYGYAKDGIAFHPASVIHEVGDRVPVDVLERPATHSDFYKE